VFCLEDSSSTVRTIYINHLCLLPYNVYFSTTSNNQNKIEIYCNTTTRKIYRNSYSWGRNRSQSEPLLNGASRKMRNRSNRTTYLNNAMLQTELLLNGKSVEKYYFTK